jgi:hypothetical protein
MNGWEEFDETAAYQKKLVDREMRQWILANSCRRIIPDRYFNNPVHNQSMDNLFLKRRDDRIIYSTPTRPVLQ